MFLLKRLLLVCVCFIPYEGNINAAIDPTDDIPFCLSKSALSETQEITQEFCRYYKRNGSEIKLKEDVVYGSEYDTLNQAIEEDLDFVRPKAKNRYGFTSCGHNYLTVILASTGKKGTHVARHYTPLYIRDGTNTGFSLSSKGTKPVVFACSNRDINKCNEKNPGRKFINKDLFEVREDLVVGDNNTHTEPLALSVLLSLSSDTFRKILPKQYDLEYCEVHFISTNDACLGCAQSICKGLPEMKAHFCSNIFTFFHGNVPYGTGYTAKYNEAGIWKGVHGSLGSNYFQVTRKFDHSLQLRSVGAFQESPSYYIATFREMEDFLDEGKRYGIGKYLESELKEGDDEED